MPLQIFALKNIKKGKSEVDRVFEQTLTEFKSNLLSTYSIATKQNTVNVKYKDLIANFLQVSFQHLTLIQIKMFRKKVMETVCQREKKSSDFPVTMGVNAFRGFLNEFMAQNKPEEKPKEKRKKEKKRDDLVTHGNHLFQLVIINIPTACEVCSSFLKWPIERGLVCQCKCQCFFAFFLQIACAVSCSLQINLP